MAWKRTEIAIFVRRVENKAVTDVQHFVARR